MKLLLKHSRKQTQRYLKNKTSLLPRWIYWPQKAILFLVAFLFNALLEFMTSRILLVVSLLLAFFFGSQASSSTSDTITILLSHSIEGVSFVLTMIVVFGKSYDTTTRRDHKERITSSRKITEEKEEGL